MEVDLRMSRQKQAGGHRQKWDGFSEDLFLPHEANQSTSEDLSHGHAEQKKKLTTGMPYGPMAMQNFSGHMIRNLVVTDASSKPLSLISLFSSNEIVTLFQSRMSLPNFAKPPFTLFFVVVTVVYVRGFMTSDLFWLFLCLPMLILHDQSKQPC